MGQRFELLAYRRNWDEERVMYRDERGRVCSVPADWTSAVPRDPYVVLAAGRSLFRPEDLLTLVSRVRSLRSTLRSRESEHDREEM